MTIQEKVSSVEDFIIEDTQQQREKGCWTENDMIHIIVEYKMLYEYDKYRNLYELSLNK